MSRPDRLSLSRAATTRRATRGLQLVARSRISIPASSPLRPTGHHPSAPHAVRTTPRASARLTVMHSTVMRRRLVWLGLGALVVLAVGVLALFIPGESDVPQG